MEDVVATYYRLAVGLFAKAPSIICLAGVPQKGKRPQMLDGQVALPRLAAAEAQGIVAAAAAVV